MMITTAEILEALSQAETATPSRTADDAHTSAEIREAMGWSRAVFTREMKALKAAGKMVPAKVHREGIDGRTALVPAYRFL